MRQEFAQSGWRYNLSLALHLEIVERYTQWLENQTLEGDVL